MNKKTYTPPCVEVVEFELEDVIAASLGNQNDYSDGLTDDDIWGPGVGNSGTKYRTNWGSKD